MGHDAKHGKPLLYGLHCVKRLAIIMSRQLVQARRVIINDMNVAAGQRQKITVDELVWLKDVYGLAY